MFWSTIYGGGLWKPSAWPKRFRFRTLYQMPRKSWPWSGGSEVFLRLWYYRLWRFFRVAFQPAVYYCAGQRIVHRIWTRLLRYEEVGGSKRITGRGLPRQNFLVVARKFWRIKVCLKECSCFAKTKGIDAFLWFESAGSVFDLSWKTKCLGQRAFSVHHELVLPNALCSR